MSMVGLNASAHDIEVKNANDITIYYNFIKENTELEVTYRGSSISSYNEYTGDIVIPESVTYNDKTYSVTSIGNEAFYGCSGLTSITIPNSVTSIGWNAFNDCSGLTSVTIPNSVTSMGVGAFQRCLGLTSIEIPNGMTGIRDSAFSGCSGLTSITIPNSVTYLDLYAFSGCSSLTSVTIPNSVKYIGGSAFSGCSSLVSVTIPNSVTYLGGSAFSGCSRLASVTIGNSVTSIEHETFYNTKLKSITIGASILSISSFAFSSSSTSSGSKPTKVIWLTNTPPTNYSHAAGTVNYVANDFYTSLSNKTIYPFLSSMFEVDGVKYVPVSPSERTCDAIDCAYNETAESINIDETVSYQGVSMKVNQICPYTCYDNKKIKKVKLSLNGNIGANAFYGCTGMQSANITNNGRIGEYAFQDCGMQSATLGENVTSLGDYVFSGCSNLQGVVIPDAVTNIGKYSFEKCSSMTSAKIGSGVTIIPTYAFSGCSALNDMQIGQNVQTINTYAFADCKALESITIPKSVTSVNNYVFKGCSALKKLTMEDREDNTALTLGSIFSSSIFSSCPLDEVYIGRNISYNTSSSYGYSPFYRNTSLRSVTITDRETEISENEFYGCTNLKEVKIGDGVTTIGNRAFSGCSSLDFFSFGSAVQTIGQEAFSDCTAMTKLISKAANPPTCGTQALDDINKWNCKLLVPANSLSLYQAAPQWKEFFFIEEATGIKGITGDNTSSKATITTSYDLNGKQFSQPQKGLNILKMSDRTTRKVVK